MSNNDDAGSEVGFGGGLALVLIMILAACSACGYGATINERGVTIGQPEVYARATGIARAADLAREGTAQAMMFEATREAAAAQAMATREALSARATATSQAAAINATVVALVQQADATATAVPYQAPLVENRTNNEMARTNALTGALGAGLVLAALLGLAVVAMVRTRARIIPRGADGQLPGVMIGNSVIDPARQIGPAVTAPSGWAVFARWTVGCIAERRLLPYPDPQRLQLADGGADADHYLEAARVAGAVGVASATYRPDNAARGRKAKLEIESRRPSLGLGAPSPMTRVVITGDSAIEQIAAQLGDRLPQLGLPSNADGQVVDALGAERGGR